MSTTNRQFHFVRVPDGPLTLDCFRLESASIPDPEDGEVLLRTLYMSIDAASRALMSGSTHKGALGLGTVMVGRAVGEVMQSRHPDYTAGDLAYGEYGWREYAAVPGASLTKQPRVTPLSHLLSVYGVSGLTGYFGLLDVGRPKPGETVVISAAAGSVGTFAGQIARIVGCRVVGIAGGDEKCRWLTEELGYHEAVNYKSGPISERLKAACPNGIDVYFDNVGGETLEAVLAQMNPMGRVACCGVVSTYDSRSQGGPGPRGIPLVFVVKRLTMRGFIVADFAAKYDEALAQLRSWVEEGSLKVVEDVVEGFENLPSAMIGLLRGENRGKRMVRVGTEA